MRGLVEFFGEPISRYTMAQAIADGALVEAGDMAKEVFPWPVMLTAAAWADCVAWTEADSDRTGAYQDQDGRLWDVLQMTAFAIRAARPASDDERITVRLYRVDRTATFAGEPEAEPVELNAMLGGHNDGSPILIIGLPSED